MNFIFISDLIKDFRSLILDPGYTALTEDNLVLMFYYLDEANKIKLNSSLPFVNIYRERKIVRCLIKFVGLYCRNDGDYETIMKLTKKNTGENL